MVAVASVASVDVVVSRLSSSSGKLGFTDEFLKLFSFSYTLPISFCHTFVENGNRVAAILCLAFC